MTVEIQTLTHFGHGKKERVTRNISIDMEQVKFLPLLIICVQTAKGLIWNSSTASISVCVGNTISLDWVYTRESGEILDVTSWTKSDGAGGLIPVADDFGGFTPAAGYVGRLIAIGNAGIQISNATSSDIGTYTVVVKLVSLSIYTVNATVHVHEIANASCKPTCDSSWKCQIPQACPVQNYIDAIWTVDGVKYPNVVKCSPNNYNKPYNVCAEGDAVTLCYSGPSLCRKENPCIGTTTTTTTDTTSTTTTTTDTTSTTTTATDTTSTTTTTTDTTSTTTTTTDTTSTTTATTDTTSTTTTATDTTSTTTTELPPNDTNNTSTSKSPTTVLPSNNTDIKVIVPAVVVPCGLLIIVALVLIVVFCVRRKAGKNVRESPDGMAIQDKGNNIDEWKQSLGHGKATDNIDTVYTTPDGFIIYPGPAAISTARSYKDKKYHGVTDQYSRPNPGKHHHQADYIPSTFTSARAYTHRGKNHHVVTDQYSRPYPGNYGNQSVYFPSTYKSAGTYAQKGKTYEGHQPASNPMANSRLAYDQPAYYPQTGYYGQSGQDVYYSGGGQHSYGQRSRSHHDNNGRKQHIDYYSQYEMADYGGNRAGYRHTKQNTAFYY